MTEPHLDLSNFSHYDFVTGVESIHPRPRHSCGGIFDPRKSKDAAVCRDCGAEISGAEHASAMQAIVAAARQETQAP